MRKSLKLTFLNYYESIRAGKSIGSTNRARLVARGLIARKSGPHKGKKERPWQDEVNHKAIMAKMPMKKDPKTGKMMPDLLAKKKNGNGTKR